MKTHIKVSDIASQALFEFGEQTTHLLERAIYHGLQLVKDVALDGKLDTVKAEILPVEKNIKTVLLPADFVDSVRVAYMLDCEPKELPRADRKMVSVTNKSRQVVGQGKATYGYTVNTDSGALLLPADIEATEIMLEYVCTGINPTGDTCVHPYLEQPLLAYIYWKLIAKRKDYSMTEKKDAQAEYLKAMAKATARDTRFTVGEFLTATRAGYGIILKG